MRRCVWTSAFITLVLVAVSPAAAAAQAATGTTVEDFAWLAGTWRGQLQSGPTAEITYSEPAGGLMEGMFRLMDGEKVMVLEYMTLRETPDGLELRVRHFDPALTLGEEGDAILLRLSEHEGQRWVFENPVNAKPKRSIIERTGENSHTVHSEIILDKGEMHTIDVTWKRAEPPTPFPSESAPSESTAAAAPEDAGLAPLARLVGGQWHGKFTRPDGGTFDTRNVFEWGLGHKTIKSRAYVVAAGTANLVYEGLYTWHPGKKEIVFFESSRDGTVNEGSVTPAGDRLEYAWTTSTGEGRENFRETFRFLDGDHYNSEAFRETPQGWTKVISTKFNREPLSEPESGLRLLRKEVVVPAPLAEVWKAWTTTEGVTSFFGPQAHIDVTLGGPYEIYFGPDQPYGLRGSEDCKVHSIVPMELLAFEWNAPPTIPAIRNAGLHTLVTVELEALTPDSARVRVTQTGWGVGENWDKTYAYFDHAWEAVLSNLIYRFRVGPVAWPGHFIRAEEPASPTSEKKEKQ